MRILIVEDDPALADGLVRSLTQSGYAVDCATQGAMANTMLVGFFGTANDLSFTAPTGMTERYDVDADGTNQIGGEAADQAIAAAGATGTRAATASGSAVNIGQLVALKPSGTIPSARRLRPRPPRLLG